MSGEKDTMTGGPIVITAAIVVRSGAGLSRGVERMRDVGSTSAGATVIVAEVSIHETIDLRADCKFPKS